MIHEAYHTERKYRGRRIIIDIADVPFPLGSGPEVVVMYASNGKEIVVAYPDTMEEAVEIYNRFLEEYPEDAPAKRR